MSFGLLKFGNNYHFKTSQILLRPGETRDKLLTLNKVEIRYNTRRGLPSYPAMRSLYRWRSVFGYRLGGLIRRAVVKLSEVSRHSVNAKNFRSAMINAKALKNRPESEIDMDVVKGITQPKKKEKTQLPLQEGGWKKQGYDDARSTLVKASFQESKEGKFFRLYSTRDVILAAKYDKNDPLGPMKYLKYQKWDQIDSTWHQAASEHDYSLRKLVTDGLMNLHKPKVQDDYFESTHDQYLKNLKDENVKLEKEFNTKKKDDFKNIKKEIMNLRGNSTHHDDDFKYFNYTHKKNPTEIVPVPKLIKNMSDEELIERFPDLREVHERKFEPKVSHIPQEVAVKSDRVQKTDRQFGGILRFLEGNTIGKIERAGKIIKFQLGVIALNLGKKPEPSSYLEKSAEELQLNKPFYKEQKGIDDEIERVPLYDGQSVRSLLKDIKFGFDDKQIGIKKEDQE
jgi:hypothetical protein